MVDMDTHRIIDMIEFQETGDVAEWLKTYPNLQIFSRDGSPSYKKAIEDAHKVNFQVSDRSDLKRGLEAVENACIIHDINNGLDEGFVNKIKVIKRIMYGRCSFKTLKHKTLAIEKMKCFN